MEDAPKVPSFETVDDVVDYFGPAQTLRMLLVRAKLDGLDDIANEIRHLLRQMER